MSKPLHIRELKVGESSRLKPALCAPLGATTAVRTQVLESSVGVVENLQCAGVFHNRRDENFSPHFQVCLPYQGLFVWHVGNDDIVADSNQVLFVAGGESYSISQPRSADYPN